MASGTNDKKSVVDYVRQIWNRLDYVYPTIGTLGVIIWVRFVNLNITTSNRLLVKQPLYYLALPSCCYRSF